MECRPGPTNSDLVHRGGGVDPDDQEDDDYADYEDICNNNNNNNRDVQTTNNNSTNTAGVGGGSGGTGTGIRCDFKSYGFVRKFTKAPSIGSVHNEKSSSSSSSSSSPASPSNIRNVYNGFHDFNAIPRGVTRDDGYPYGEKIINEKQPINGTGGHGFRCGEPKDADFIFSDRLMVDAMAAMAGDKNYLNNQQQQPQYNQHGPVLSRKLNNQHVNLFNNNNNNLNAPKLEKIGNDATDFANRPLPQPPVGGTGALMARQRPVPRAVCPTPPLCRANRKGPFIFGVDSTTLNSNCTSSSSSVQGSPLLRSATATNTHSPTPTPTPVIEQWKYSENMNCSKNNSPDLLTSSLPRSNNGVASTTVTRRRDVFQRTTTNHVQVGGGKNLLLGGWKYFELI